MALSDSEYNPKRYSRSQSESVALSDTFKVTKVIHTAKLSESLALADTFVVGKKTLKRSLSESLLFS